MGKMPTLVLILLTFGTSASAAQPSAKATAQRIDAVLASELFNDPTQLAPRSDDETYLRRVWLDVVGHIPTPKQATTFALDPSPDKRERTVRQLLQNPDYGKNWARYWRDVVFSRRLEDRAILAANAMETDLARWLNESQGWDRIASRFITASGDVRKHGNTAIVMAQDGRTEEMTAEISRIFLGIQIQCAQCHDHPYDRWKRNQFHELAAFFPRVGIRRVNDMALRSFEVYGSDQARKRPKKNNDRRPQPEHFMSHLDDPTAKGTKIQPKFFLTRQTLPLGSSDAHRRSQLADWLTDNDWFAIALVNRVWSELVGEGFYEPVDDLGPDRKATAPKAVKLLASKFRQSGYDLQWLFQTICQTEAYGRESRPRRKADETPFTANVPQRLRSDQLMNAAYSALEIVESKGGWSNRERRKSSRQRFAEIFGYDPSVSRDSISASIPQVLALMNSPQVNRALAANRSSLLGRRLEAIEDNEPLIVELYLRCLSRQPTDEELSLLLTYSEEIGDRRQAFEDILWALVNSAEFQHRK
ncbi:MAG: DUF1549 domain-containing protein [Planctomycetes bacterium]|nr:DUF1549 domain-containing protein [Planctomycetota bacterium]